MKFYYMTLAWEERKGFIIQYAIISQNFSIHGPPLYILKYPVEVDVAILKI